MKDIHDADGNLIYRVPTPNPEKFQREYLGTWAQESESEKRLRELAEKYHQLTEAYDRTVCTGGYSPRNRIMPANGHESGLINKNARRVRDELWLEAQTLGINRSQWHDAICKAAHPANYPLRKSHR